MQSRASRRKHSEPRAKATVAILGATRHFRECLELVLTGRRNFNLVNVGSYEPADLARLASLRPDAVLLDLVGISTTDRPGTMVQHIAGLLPAAALIVIDGNAGDSEILEYFEAGLTAFVPRSASLDDLEEMIGKALRRELQCPPSVTAIMVRRLKELAGRRPVTVGTDRLSPREHSVLRLVEQGLTNKQIAVRLGIEAATVKNHVHRILKKLAVHRRGEAASHARHRAPGDVALLDEDAG